MQQPIFWQRNHSNQQKRSYIQQISPRQSLTAYARLEGRSVRHNSRQPYSRTTTTKLYLVNFLENPITGFGGVWGPVGVVTGHGCLVTYW